MKRRTLALTLALSAFAIERPASACSIPVFRFALERWSPSPYELLVFHRGSTAVDQKLLDMLAKALDTSNLSIVDVDLRKPLSAELRKVWDGQPQDASPPWLVLRFPEGDEKRAVAWSGTLSAANVDRLLRSAARLRLAKRLTSGDSGVMLLLTSGDAGADDKAGKLLDVELARLKKTIELPEPKADGPQLRYELPLRVSFPVVRLSRSDPDEALLIRMLLGCDEGLDKVAGPIVFPIFGRGRVLCGLHGEDLTAGQVERTVQFLCAACSCQVKELNPGMDLLVDANWTDLLGRPSVVEKEEPAEVKLPSPAIPPGEAGLAPPTSSFRPMKTDWLPWATGGASFLFVVTGWWAFRRHRMADAV